MGKGIPKNTSIRHPMSFVRKLSENTRSGLLTNYAGGRMGLSSCIQNVHSHLRSLKMKQPDAPVVAKDHNTRTYYTVDQMSELPEFQMFSKSALRHLIFNSRPRPSASGGKLPGNGLVEAGAIVRIGRRILIDIDSFRNWLGTHNEQVK